MDNTVTILGARGSIPVSGPAYQRYGGASTCILVELNGVTVLVDAGTGILDLPARVLEQPRLTMVLTHAHIDHMLGLTMCPYLFRQGAVMELYAAPMEGRNAEEQVAALFAPPLWPVGPEMLPAEMNIHDLPEVLHLGDVLVETMPGEHPGGVILLRISGSGKSVVIATDCTVTDQRMPEYAGFAADCDLLLCDGQYSQAEWKSKSDFGHSTWVSAARLAKAANAKAARVIHHDPNHGDDELDTAASEVQRIYPACGIAYQGEVIRL